LDLSHEIDRSDVVEQGASEVVHQHRQTNA
jgi:hypothetical protein